MNLLFFVSFILIIISTSAYAQIEVLTPTVSNARVAAAPDYATQVLGNPWDMDSRSDLADYIQHADYGSGISHYSNFVFNNNRFNYKILSATASQGFFHLLSPGQPGTNPLGKNGQVYPIKSGNYRYLIIRAWASRKAVLRVLWNLGPSYASYVRTLPQTLQAGWHTYVIDLASVSGTPFGSPLPNSSWLANPNITGIRMDTYKQSTSDPNIDVSIDWVRLVGVATNSYSVGYNFTAQGDDTLFSLFLDNDNNPYNGYHDQILMAANTGSSINYFPTYANTGSYRVVGVTSDDFATLNGMPWFMSSTNEIKDSASVANLSVAGGVLSGTASSTTAYIDLNLNKNLIDTSKFRYLTVRLNASVAGNTQLRWYNANNLQLGSAQQFHNAGNVSVEIDLQAIGSWSGQVAALRIYPKFGQSNYNFSIDYVTLRGNNYSATEPSVPTVSISPGNLVINQTPQINIITPNPRGGADFATEKLGKPWNMSSITDVSYVQNLEEAWIYPNNYMNERQGDFFCARNKSNNEDPFQVSYQTTARSANDIKIDASRYKNASIDFFIAREQDVVNGSVLRMIAWNMNRDAREINGDDVMIPHIGPGWVNITQDLTKLRLEEIIHPPNTFPNPPWAGFFEMFRIDVNEFSEPTWYCIDSIELRADHESNSKFALAYQAHDSDSVASDINVAWYYSLQESTNGGTHITTRNLDENSRVFVWNTSSIPQGTYWIHARISDGHSESRRIGHRLVINRALTEDQIHPELQIVTPTASSSWRQNIRLAGYAIDNRQIALVEVLIDGQLVHTFVPNRFNKSARDLFPSYADSSRAGFDEIISISNLALGAHTLIVKATDTSGNVTEQTVAINRIAGNDLSNPTTPVVNEPRIAVPLNGRTSKQMAEIRYRAKQKKLAIKFTNLHACTDVQLVGHHNINTLRSLNEEVVLFKSFSALSEIYTITASKVSGYARLPSLGDGHFAFGVLCDNKLIHHRRVNFRNGLPAMKKHESFVKMLTKRIKQARSN